MANLTSPSLKIQCKNYFKNEDNKSLTLSYLWAKIITHNEKGRGLESKLKVDYDEAVHYNEAVQSCPSLNFQKEGEGLI